MTNEDTGGRTFLGGVVAALCREAAIAASSNLPPSADAEDRQEWCLRWCEAAVEGGGGEQSAIEGAGMDALSLRGFHGRHDRYFRPVLGALLSDDALATATEVTTEQGEPEQEAEEEA